MLGARLEFVDQASFLFMYDEIFSNEIYRISPGNDSPFIIDAGANIGLGVLYFKSIYPKAQIVAFEPDYKIFSVCQRNIASFEHSNIELLNYALWGREGAMPFWSQGADAGRLDAPNRPDEREANIVQAVKLSSYIDRTVDLVKIDIEGAETVVIEECQEHLDQVNNIFVEYHSFSERPQTLGQLLLILKQRGFRVSIQSVGARKSPFINKANDREMDMQLNIFGYRT